MPKLRGVTDVARSFARGLAPTDGRATGWVGQADDRTAGEQPVGERHPAG